MISFCFLFLYAAFIDLCRAQASAGQALNVPPSGQWDGVDGPWSTFNMGVGEPVQSFRCLPGLNLPVAIVPTDLGWPSSRGCDSISAISPCRKRVTFYNNLSTTYNATGVLNATNYFELDGFNLLDRRQWVVGRDTIRFGHNAIQNQGFPSQYVYGVDSLDYFLGMFGLAPGLVSTPIIGSNLFTAMAGQFAVPSLSFSYTAGSASRNTTGSLVLGGYDTARFDASTTVYADMPSKENDTLIVDVHAIHLDLHSQTEATWRPPSEVQTLAFRISSLLSQIWLPLEACVVFEKIFGLVWNSTLEAYILDKAMRAALMEQNPSVTFSLSGSEAPPKNFTLPYSAFDLQLSPPLVNDTLYYFPLKRAENSLQYVFGRTFLQETYITIDYERSNFSLSQAYPIGGSGYIVPVYNATYVPIQQGNESTKFSAGAYAGIGIGAGIAAIIVVSLLLSWKKRWGPFRRKSVIGPDAVIKPELHSEGIPRVEAMEKERFELADKERVEAMDMEMGELETIEPSHEAGGLGSSRVEVINAVHELDGDFSRRSESLPRGA